MFYLNYKQKLKSSYPEIQKVQKDLGWEHVVSPKVLELPHRFLKEIKQLIIYLDKLKNQAFYLDILQASGAADWDLNHKQDSVLQAYDFHITEEGPKLIEVNTNGAGFLISHLIYKTQGLESDSYLQALESSFRSEWMKFSGSKSPPSHVAIIDEQPMEQKMLGEFIMYKHFFESMNWQAQIYPSTDLIYTDQQLITSSGQKVDFVYNRLTDFYFSKHAHLDQAYRQGACCFSPHPVEYFLLSDKNRMCDWWKHKDILEYLDPVKKNLIPTYLWQEEDTAKLWENRKQYVFKPLQSHGSKGVYRGKSLSRSKFEQLKLTCSSFLYQDYIPPREQDSWKQDLRVYAYGQDVQMAVMRLYKGQVTNFREKGGGFAAVSWV